MTSDAHGRPQTPLRRLPAVDALLQQPAISNLLAEYPRSELTRAVRIVLERRRKSIVAGESTDVTLPTIALDVRSELQQRARRNLRRVINATGIVIHTGLGRAPLAEEAIEALNDIASGYGNLEFDLDSGQRGDRHACVQALLCELTGAEDALVVNNNAAATYLTLNTLAVDSDAIISRGELVEIGGSYRMPDVMAAARCRMVEVGTTNRTHLSDYERALSEFTAAVIRVHTSNYRIEGFVAKPTLRALAALRDRCHGQWHLIDDLGSGWLSDTLVAPDANVLASEPSVCASIADGADVALFSGDKLLGGPQAGIIVGRRELLARMRQNPLMRILRPDKLCLAALEATLRLYREPRTLIEHVPVLRMLLATPESIRERAEELQAQLSGALGESADVALREEDSYAGGGALPAIALPTWCVQVCHPDLRIEQVTAALRTRDLPVIARIRDDALVLDCRTITTNELEPLVLAISEVLREG